MDRRGAAAEVIRPAIFGVLVIITVVSLPIFALTGIEGKMFHPMALTVVIALGCAIVLSRTSVPAAVTVFVTGKVDPKHDQVIDWLKHAYRPALAAVLKWRYAVIAAALVPVPPLDLPAPGSPMLLPVHRKVSGEV